MDMMHTTCLRCGQPAVSIPFDCESLGMKVSYTHYSYCESCLREGLDLLKERESKTEAQERKVPIQSLIDHIKTATDVDPWAKEMAEELLKKQKPMKPSWNCGSAYCGNCGQKLPRKHHEYERNYCSNCGQAVKFDE